MLRANDFPVTGLLHRVVGTPGQASERCHRKCFPGTQSKAALGLKLVQYGGCTVELVDRGHHVSGAGPCSI